MTAIPIQMLREHRFPADGERHGDMILLPLGWSGELDEEAAIVAIATGAARARVSLNDEQTLAVEIVKAATAKDDARLAELRLQVEKNATPAGSDAATAAAAAAAMAQS